MIQGDGTICVGWALVGPDGCNPSAFAPCRFNSCSTHCRARSSSGLGFSASQAGDTGSIPVRAITGQVVEWQTHGPQKAVLITGVGVQVSPWSLLRVEEFPAEAHNLSPPGTTPGPATVFVGRVRKLAKRPGREPGDVCGFNSHLGYSPCWRGGSQAKTRSPPRQQGCAKARNCDLWGGHVPRAARLPCKQPVMGSIPILSTRKMGLLVQQEDICIARRKSECNSPAVHSYPGLIVQQEGHQFGRLKIRVQLPVGPQ